MTDELLEEFASLYVMGMLEGLELAAFEAQLARDPALRQRVRELTEAASALAFHAPAAEPPSALRHRILARTAEVTPARPAAPVVAFRMPVWLPWAAAAVFALASGWFAQLYVAARAESAALRDLQAATDFELKSTKHQMEAERIIARQEVATARAGTGELNQALKLAREQAEASAIQLAAAQKLIAARDLQLSLETQRAADLEERAKREADLANFKIATLASLLGNSPQAVAVAVWNPARQEGVLRVEHLPPLTPDHDYQLWLIDPQYPIPVDGGVFTVNPATGDARVQFKADKPVKTVAKFAVSLERKGGVAKAEGPMVLLGP
ncbi:MAG: anti-sigma factor [Verrucomicrobia bacterium]|nr:anti-sigma factor [Verrucomicrobiota bacterium]